MIRGNPWSINRSPEAEEWGYVNFNWDTTLAALMLSLDAPELAASTLTQVARLITWNAMHHADCQHTQASFAHALSRRFGARSIQTHAGGIYGAWVYNRMPQPAPSTWRL